MSKSYKTLVLIVLACTCLAGMAVAQNTAKPRYAALPPHSYYATSQQPPAGNLSQWNGSYKHKGQTINFTMVGPDPRTNNATTTVPVYIIPVKMVYGSSNGNMTFDPTLTTNFNGKSAQTVLTSSPLLTSSVDFVQGGTDLGTGQYIDTYQRGNFWKVLKTKNYHVVLGTPTILPTQTITVQASQGSVISNPFLPSKKVGTMDIFAFRCEAPGFPALSDPDHSR